MSNEDRETHVSSREKYLCRKKGHMWFFDERKEVFKEDGIYSVTITRACARCGIKEDYHVK